MLPQKLDRVIRWRVQPGTIGILIEHHDHALVLQLRRPLWIWPVQLLEDRMAVCIDRQHGEAVDPLPDVCPMLRVTKSSPTAW